MPGFPSELQEPHMNYTRGDCGDLHDVRVLSVEPWKILVRLNPSSVLSFRGRLLNAQYRCFKRLYTKLSKSSLTALIIHVLSCMQGISWFFLATCIVSNCWISVNRRRHLNLSEYAAVYTTLKLSLKFSKFNLKNDKKKLY